MWGFKTSRINGSRLLAELFGGLVLNGPVLPPPNALTYGASIALDMSLGNEFTVSVTDANAFVFAAPTNTPPTGFDQYVTIRIRNTSGGAHGAGTFNAIFKTAGAVPAIANGSSRVFQFRWNGTNLVETFRSAADIAN